MERDVVELVDTESLVPQEYLLRKVDNPKNQRYAMSVCALRSVPRSDGIPSRCWSRTILNSTTGSMLVRPSSSLYNGSTISYSFLNSTALSTLRSRCSCGTRLSVSTSSTTPRSIFPVSIIFLTLFHYTSCI